jgi:hypothetical protein
VNFTLRSGRKLWFQGLGELIQTSEGNSAKILSFLKSRLRKIGHCEPGRLPGVSQLAKNETSLKYQLIIDMICIVKCGFVGAAL